MRRPWLYLRSGSVLCTTQDYTGNVVASQYPVVSPRSRIFQLCYRIVPQSDTCNRCNCLERKINIWVIWLFWQGPSELNRYALKIQAAWRDNHLRSTITRKTNNKNATGNIIMAYLWLDKNMILKLLGYFMIWAFSTSNQQGAGHNRPSQTRQDSFGNYKNVSELSYWSSWRFYAWIIKKRDAEDTLARPSIAAVTTKSNYSWQRGKYMRTPVPSRGKLRPHRPSESLT